MTIAKPLIAGSGQQFFRVSADCTWANRCAAIQVYSVTLEGKRTIDHAQCQVKFFDRDLVGSEFRRNSYLIRRSIDGLEKKAESGRAHRMQRRMVYKLFSSLVDYDNDFRSMKEVILDSDEYEATALVKFQGPQGDFYRSPYWIDSLGHLSGFVMNANDATDSESQVFVNHGWEFMRCLKDFSPDATYRTYVKMQPLKGSIWAGDVYIFDGDEIVGISGGIRVCFSFIVYASSREALVPSPRAQDLEHRSPSAEPADSKPASQAAKSAYYRTQAAKQERAHPWPSVRCQRSAWYSCVRGWVAGERTD